MRESSHNPFVQVIGKTLGQYLIEQPIGEGGPASARAADNRELRRGLAIAKEWRCW
jgi:hypothetical protein